MRNLLSYLSEYGHIPFKSSPLNEVDGLILCQLAYLQFDKVIKNKDEKITLKDIFTDENIPILNEMTFSPKANIKLMKQIRESRRFRNVRISHIENHLSYEEGKQFYALTYHILDYIYICFRGTDLTILGWKEDFDMAHMKEIPSQRLAVEYVNNIFSIFKTKVYIGGHSKGGNLATYSAIKSNEDVKKYIERVYSFDGPGFNSELLCSNEYYSVKDKIIVMTAKEAIIAMLLYQPDNIIFIKTKGLSILQHIPYNWGVDGNSLKRIKRNTASSRWFARTVRHFYEETSEYERKRFVDLLFTIVEVSPENTVEVLKKKPFRFIRKINKKYRSLEKEDRVFFKGILKKYRKSSYHVFKVKIKSLFAK